jgi:hypothetical protein
MEEEEEELSTLVNIKHHYFGYRTPQRIPRNYVRDGHPKYIYRCKTPSTISNDITTIHCAGILTFGV